MRAFILQTLLIAVLVPNTFAFTVKFKIALRDLLQVDGVGDDPDAYVSVIVNGKRRFTTDAIHSEQNPRWNEIYSLTGLNERSRIDFEILDYDTARSNKIHGIVGMKGNEFKEVSKINNEIVHRGATVGRLILDVRSIQADD